MIGSFTSVKESSASAVPRPAKPAQDIRNTTKADATGMGWLELLGQTIETEILPRMLSSHRDDPAEGIQQGLNPVGPVAIAAYVDLILASDMEQMRAVADRVIVQCGGRQALLDQLLTPAARRLGDLWDRDLCDFMEVTLGVYRLDQIMKETAPAGCDTVPANGFDRRILLLPVPGEQHGFGSGMLADVFREVGWCVRSGPISTQALMLRLVREEWFDVIGLSLSADRWLKGLPATIRAVRAASCNPNVFVMLGGRAIIQSAERTRFMGADATPPDAWTALSQVEDWMRGRSPQEASPARTGAAEGG